MFQGVLNQERKAETASVYKGDGTCVEGQKLEVEGRGRSRKTESPYK